VIRFLADEDFNNAIVRGILRLRSDIDIVRVQDVGLRTLDDTTVLAWAAQENRILLTYTKFQAKCHNGQAGKALMFSLDKMIILCHLIANLVL
jgi:hypothetical protein